MFEEAAPPPAPPANVSAAPPLTPQVHVKVKAPAAAGAAPGAALHCYHGFGSNTWSWSLVQQRLADRLGALVTAHDMPGFGLTERCAAAPMGVCPVRVPCHMMALVSARARSQPRPRIASTTAST